MSKKSPPKVENIHPFKPFFSQVYEIVQLIPKGRVSSYGAIAKCVGVTARMVGWTMNFSHIHYPKIPAHRVVNRNGSLTGKHHFKTSTTMQKLLEKEGLIIKNDKIKQFNIVFWNPRDEIQV